MFPTGNVKIFSSCHADEGGILSKFKKLQPIGYFFRRPSVTNSIIQKSQIRVHSQYQINFLLSSPAFEFFFSCYGIVYILKWFVVKKIVTEVPPCKSFLMSPVNPMFNQPLYDIISYTNIKYLLFGIGYYVNVILLIISYQHTMNLRCLLRRHDKTQTIWISCW